MADKNLKKIALFGLFGVNNIGNEATLAATVQAIKARFSFANLIIVSEPPNAASGLGEFRTQMPHDVMPVARCVQWIRFYWLREGCRGFLQLLTEPLRWLRTRRLARGIDLLLIAGTGIADDFYQGPFDVPHHLKRWCSAVRANGGSVKFLSIGAGPVDHPLSIRWFREAMNMADYRSYRERSSHKFAMDIGIHAENDAVLPDMVFSLPVTDPELLRPVQWPPRTIGIGVMGYLGWNVNREAGERIYAGYIEKLRLLVGELIRRGHAVRLVVGTRGADQRPVTDLLAMPEFQAAVAAGSLVASPMKSYLDVLADIAKTDLLIATRFHNVLFALLLERPVVSIEYAAKNTDLMVEMGLGRYCHSIETFDPVTVLAQFDELKQLPEAPLRVVRERLGQYREALEFQYDMLVTRK
jgi:polysaccharide pyruvyl transferase WcaK-like protein